METHAGKRPSRMLIAGSVLWTLCLAGILWIYTQQWQRPSVVVTSESNSRELPDDTGKNGKQISLVPQKDGSLVVKEVTQADRDDPWDAAGIEDFSFTDTNGKKLTKQDLLGKPFVIAFVFTLCRGPCPDVTLQMRELQDRLKNYDFNLVTLTVDPARDDLKTLETYGKNFGANFDRWKFLTGDQTEIYGLIHRSFKMPVKEIEGPNRVPGFEIIHSTNIMLVDATGRVVGKFDAQNEEARARLRKELKRIANRKADAKEVGDGE